ncbi:hypothetical protein L6452_27890 [Arctium lappa]|uniref:Uncharacterized protein n=1 Tax=Arctium lappa TaxID=4217 RepID=A0ACB8ZW07_ARCLA|nr:hypothetical protein L6452_27890 [Arctium lappa]
MLLSIGSLSNGAASFQVLLSLLGKVKESENASSENQVKQGPFSWNFDLEDERFPMGAPYTGGKIHGGNLNEKGDVAVLKQISECSRTKFTVAKELMSKGFWILKLLVVNWEDRMERYDITTCATKVNMVLFLN